MNSFISAGNPTLQHQKAQPFAINAYTQNLNSILGWASFPYRKM